MMTYQELLKFINSKSCKDVLYVDIIGDDDSVCVIPVRTLSQGNGRIGFVIDLEGFMGIYDAMINEMTAEIEAKRMKAKELVKHLPGYGKKYVLWTRVEGTNTLWYSDAATSHANGLSGVEWDDGNRWATKLKSMKSGTWVMFEAGIDPNINKDATPLSFPTEYLLAYDIDPSEMNGHLPIEQQNILKAEAARLNLERVRAEAASVQTVPSLPPHLAKLQKRNKK